MKRESLTFNDRKQYVLAKFHHDLDMEVMMALKPEIDRTLPLIDKAIIVDLSQVTFLDSSAVGILALFFRHTQKYGVPMIIAAAQSQPEAVLGMVGLSDHVPLYGDLKAAETALTALKPRE